YFFFSSRRRHTRSDRDWSSDVCSSDLRDWPPFLNHRQRRTQTPASRGLCIIVHHLGGLRMRVHAFNRTNLTLVLVLLAGCETLRSEERRVGKECGGWGRAPPQKQTLSD